MSGLQSYTHHHTIYTLRNLENMHIEQDLLNKYLSFIGNRVSYQLCKHVFCHII